MSIESHADWEGLRAAARVARLTLDTLTTQLRPGGTTGDLDRTAARLFAAHGARSAPALVYGFPRTVLISLNDEIVHGIPGARRIGAGDIVKIDVSVEKTATLPTRRVLSSSSRRARLRSAWPNVHLPRLTPRLPLHERACASTRLAVQSNGRCDVEASPSSGAWPATAWVARFTRSRQCRITTIPFNGTC